MKITIPVPAEQAGLRADAFLAEVLEDCSRSMTQKLLEEGCVTGGGQPRPKEEISIVREKRIKALYSEDEGKPIRKSHENPSLMEFYEEWGK